jgi:hypothetical protein
LPADVAANAAIEGWSQDRIDQEMQKYTMPEGLEDGAIETPVVTQEELAAVSTDGANSEPPATPTFDFTELGFNSIDELKSYVTASKGYKDDAAKYKEVEDIVPFARDIKNPFANDTIHRLNNFVRTTGIDDLNLATAILNTSDETLKTNPVKALAILEILNDKELAGLGLDRVMEYVANKNNMDVDATFDSVDEMPIGLRIEAQKALKSIENKRKEFDTNQDYFTYLQTQRNDSQRATDERSQQWETVLSKVPEKMKSIPIKVNVEDVGDVTIDFAVSKEDLDRYIPEIKQYMTGMAPDEQGVQTAMKVLENRVWLENREQIMKEVLKSAAGKLKEDTIRSVHNGGKVVDRKDAPSGDTKESPHLSATRAALGF